jgi:hypothetical protein
MQTQAKYGGNVLSLASKLGFCLTKDETDLRVTICHIRRSRFRTRAHILPISDDNSCHCHCRLLNPKLISLRMRCFHYKLTSLISQALLQAALDNKPSVLHGWLLLREFSSLPVNEAIGNLRKRQVSTAVSPEEAVLH